jgi:uncharacterized protein Usg
LNPNKYKYYWPCHDLEPEFNHIVAVVLFKKDIDSDGEIHSNNYVLNMWAVYIYSKR